MSKINKLMNTIVLYLAERKRAFQKIKTNLKKMH